MSKHEVVATDAAPKAIGPYVQAVVHSGVLFASGCLPLCPESMKIQGSEIKDQTTQVLKNVRAVLMAVDVDPSNVLKTTVFLQSMGDFAAFNQVYAEFFGETKPARSCVEVAKLPLGALVEIEVSAK
ncbi:hypothetical protein I308_105354 [Cryptococcus tetragattii IND107]|uniref:Uncharacterized protein n=1 Tax=Cryptococcus tetragattii IND107 TaxID=1296105 RepID=A0ABR3BMS7_9TREE